jgi:hydroxymethylpyrimidine/phosphomethylpyrimidine kinase
LKIALSIAGSDSGAGAGIQADLKVFSALDVYGCTAITAITAQNTKHVAEIFEIAPSIVKQQRRLR